jgi:hypothetical protein
MKPKASTKARGQGGEAARPRPEFSRRVDVHDITTKGLDLTIAADAAECAALARRGDLVAVESLAADFRLRNLKESQVEVEGVLRARVVQICVVSLEAFASDIECPIEVDFAADISPEVEPARSLDARGGATTAPSGEREAPDPIIDGRIDLGAVAAEFLMLSLEPYPRKPGVSFDDTGHDVGEPEVVSPFAALRKLGGQSSGDD